MNLRYLRGTGMNTFTVDYLMWHHFGRRLDECSPDIVRQYRVYFQHLPNPTNLAMFIESYVNRTAIAISRDGQSGPQLNVPVLQIVGAGSPFVNDTVEVNTKLDPAHSDWIKVSDACGLVLDDRPEVVTESMMLFLQGLGYFPTMNVVKLMKKIQDTQNGSYSATCDHVNEC
ncbi:Ndr family protein [Cooperia oncophora]